jgi:DNA (cytosine-5)-methyltransferase 1
MALIQGFPADYQFTGSLSMKYRQIGDAVPPLVACQIAKAIAADAAGLTDCKSHEPDQLRLAV